MIPDGYINGTTVKFNTMPSGQRWCEGYGIWCLLPGKEIALDGITCKPVLQSKKISIHKATGTELKPRPLLWPVNQLTIVGSIKNDLQAGGDNSTLLLYAKRLLKTTDERNRDPAKVFQHLLPGCPVLWFHRHCSRLERRREGMPA